MMGLGHYCSRWLQHNSAAEVLQQSDSAVDAQDVRSGGTTCERAANKLWCEGYSTRIAGPINPLIGNGTGALLQPLATE